VRPQLAAQVDVIDLLVCDRLQEAPDGTVGQLAHRAAWPRQRMLDVSGGGIARTGLAHTVLVGSLGAQASLSAELPSGRQFEIRRGRQHAVVVEVGATLREYSIDGVPAIDGFRHMRWPMAVAASRCCRGRTDSPMGCTPSTVASCSCPSTRSADTTPATASHAG